LACRGVGFDGGCDLGDDSIDGLTGEGSAIAEGLGVLVEELVNSVDVPEGLGELAFQFEAWERKSYIELLVGVVLFNSLGVERWASVASDQVAGKASEALQIMKLAMVSSEPSVVTYVELQVALSKSELFTVGLGAILSDPVGDVLVHIHYLMSVKTLCFPSSQLTSLPALGLQSSGGVGSAVDVGSRSRLRCRIGSAAIVLAFN